MSEQQGPESPPPPPPATPPPAAPANPAAPAAPVRTPSETEVKNWCMGAHLSALLGFFFPTIGHIGGPLVVFLMKKDDLPVAAGHAKEALNFQISLFIWALIGSAISVPLMFVIIGFFTMAGVWLAYYILSLLFPVLAGLAATEGRNYRYPMTMRLVS